MHFYNQNYLIMLIVSILPVCCCALLSFESFIHNCFLSVLYYYFLCCFLVVVCFVLFSMFLLSGTKKYLA